MTDDTDWTDISFDPPKNAGEEKSPPVSIHACPKCGRPLGRGAHFHIRACKGDK